VNDVKNPSSRRQSFLWWIIIGAFILFGLVAFVAGVRDVYRAWESETWPAAEGVVRNSYVEYETDSDHEDRGTYWAEVRYEFTVDGRTRTGARVAFGGDAASSDPSSAQTIVNRYPAGAAVTVYYRPGNPDVCVLEPGLKGQAWIFPALGLLFFIIGCVMAALLPRLLRKQEERELEIRQAQEEIRQLIQSVTEGHLAEEIRQAVPPRAARQAFFQDAMRRSTPGARFFISRVFPPPFILFGLLIIYLWASGKSESDSWAVLAFGIGFLAAGLLVAILLPRAIRRALASPDTPRT
jgi:hypothetical protein